MNNLNKARTYLSGPIDRSKDLGTSWRDKFTQLSKDHDLNLCIINPCNKPIINTKNVQQEFLTTKQYRDVKDWEGLQKFVKSFRKMDLRFTDIADFLVIYIDTSIHMCGSYDELFLAESQRKPVFCIIEGGISELPTWLFGVFNLEHIFPTVESCINYLVKINTGEIPLNNNWVLIGDYFENSR